MKCSHRLPLAFTLALAYSTTASLAQDQVHRNQDAFRFATELIENGHFVPDKKGSWREHRRSVSDENEFIRTRGMAAYASWHLGMDSRHGENSKVRCKFPFGDFQNVHRCALLAIRSRAREYGYAEMENAAAQLQRILESKARRISERGD
jgi:hypothetical protein